MYHVIIAGGVGSRFWPMSTKENPKQFLNLIGDKSLIRLTYERLLKIAVPNKILIVTSTKYKSHISSQLPEIPESNIIFEPSPKNTAPAIYIVTQFINTLEKNSVVGVYPADHYIQNENKFIDSINNIEQFILKGDKSIVTMGIEPTYPSTSYGYININNEKNEEICKVSDFIEKPNIDKANRLIQNKNNLWNSGMFFFRSETMLSEIHRFIPKIKDLYSKIKSVNDINVIWDQMPSDSIDYSVMEKTDKAYCFKCGDIGWSDLGTWMAIYDLLDKDNNNNVIKGSGDVTVHNSFNNLIIGENKQTSVVGMNNVAIINLEDKTLVIDLSKSEDVRHIIKKIKNNLL